MKIQDFIDLEDLKYMFLVSNTAGYLYNSFYSSESVVNLLSCSDDELVEFLISEHDDLNDFEKYIILLALLFALGRKNLKKAEPFFECCIEAKVLHVEKIYFKLSN